MTQPDTPAPCMTCKWWMGRVVGRTYEVGECRRYPPFLKMPGSARWKWPPMAPHDFCGEHQPKDAQP